MPVLHKVKHAALLAALSARYAGLLAQLDPRPLKSAGEGIRKPGSSWVDPGAMVATKGSSMDVRLALSDFDAALKEIRGAAK